MNATGRREARVSWLGRLMARAGAQELAAFVVPGPEVARSRGLNLAAAGLPIADTPRHASVLVLVGEVPAGLKDAAAVAYAQMPRPRAVLAVGAGDVSPLPEPDVSVSPDQDALAEGVAELRRSFAEGAFCPGAADFDVEAVRTRTEYACPMHPEVVREEPGSCPICAMDLVPRDAAMGGMDHGGIGHGAMDHGSMDHGAHDDGSQGTMEHDGREHEDRGSMHHEEDGEGRGEPDGAHEEAVDHGYMQHGPGTDSGNRVHTGHGEMSHGETEQAESQAVARYACPMHPEVVSDEPGSCPKCGMNLVPREGDGANREEHGGHAGIEHEGAAGEHEPHEGMNHGGEKDHAGHEGGSEEQAGAMVHGGPDQGDMDRGGTDHENMGHGGMDHGGMNHGGMGHEGMDHGDMGFMSMVEMTQGTPRSSDGLQMEWVEATFGPLFPGLPGGLSLTFTLDGDTVAETEVGGEMEGWAPVEILAGPADGLADRAARLDPLSPVAYRLLALRAVEDATGTPPDEETALARVGALERERAASHLGWLASFAHLLGYAWLEGRAARLQLALLGAEDAGAVARLRGEAKGLGRRVERTPLLRRKLAGLGELGEESHVRGRLARAAGRSADVRADDEAYRSLGFGPVVVDGDDALSRLRARLREIEQSIDLVERAGKISLPDGAPREREPAAGTGTATVETPRGAATLGATFEGGEVVEAELDSPSTRRLSLVEGVTEGQEFANALVAVASLDLSPWEVAR